MRAQFMMGNRTKFLIFGLLFLLAGMAFYAQSNGMISLPFNPPEFSFNLFGFAITLDIALILLGVLLIIISRLFSY